jgi:hypothetical protein
LCPIRAADIGTNGEIRLIFNPHENIYINHGTANSIHASKVRWLSEDTFEVELEVKLWNYGCADKTFDVMFYVDQLPCKLKFGSFNLISGVMSTYRDTATVKLKSKCGDHELVFIADPKEHKNQPYPNSYLNNVIHGTLKIVCGGTVRGD